jgi:hypothetical protein
MSLCFMCVSLGGVIRFGAWIGIGSEGGTCTTMSTMFFEHYRRAIFKGMKIKSLSFSCYFVSRRSDLGFSLIFLRKKFFIFYVTKPFKPNVLVMCVCCLIFFMFFVFLFGGNHSYILTNYHPCWVASLVSTFDAIYSGGESLPLMIDSKNATCLANLVIVI